ncbi:hypothetical protein pipiens_011446 [Culex pipiens pipiens]|uniref:Reverse transcriptase n=1 Tax=Culex pipiens pipiens TaxID=38569 RepID=A0ABD1D6F7_CULPP
MNVAMTHAHFGQEKCIGHIFGLWPGPWNRFRVATVGSIGNGLTRNVKNSLAKMKLAGYPVYILKLLNSFLKPHSFQVAVDGALSCRQEIPFGVPQGAVLSPALYNIFTLAQTISSHSGILPDSNSSQM